MSTLDESFEAIMDSVIRKLEAEQAPGKTLSGVKKIIRGDRSEPTPYTPCIWVFGETATPDDNYTTLQERWTQPIALVSVVSNYDTDEGYREATKLAALARSVVIKQRRLSDKDGNPLQMVQDIKSARFEPSAPWHKQGNLFSAVAVVDVIFRVMEV